MKRTLSIEFGVRYVQFFRNVCGLGVIETDAEMISYNSVKPFVATGISVSKQGIIIANITLHDATKQV